MSIFEYKYEFNEASIDWERTEAGLPQKVYLNKAAEFNVYLKPYDNAKANKVPNGYNYHIAVQNGEEVTDQHRYSYEYGHDGQALGLLLRKGSNIEYFKTATYASIDSENHTFEIHGKSYTVTLVGTVKPKGDIRFKYKGEDYTPETYRYKDTLTMEFDLSHNEGGELSFNVEDFQKKTLIPFEKMVVRFYNEEGQVGEAGKITDNNIVIPDGISKIQIDFKIISYHYIWNTADKIRFNLNGSSFTLSPPEAVYDFKWKPVADSDVTVSSPGFSRTIEPNFSVKVFNDGFVYRDPIYGTESTYFYKLMPFADNDLMMDFGTGKVLVFPSGEMQFKLNFPFDVDYPYTLKYSANDKSHEFTYDDYFEAYGVQKNLIVNRPLRIERLGDGNTFVVLKDGSIHRDIKVKLSVEKDGQKIPQFTSIINEYLTGLPHSGNDVEGLNVYNSGEFEELELTIPMHSKGLAFNLNPWSVKLTDKEVVKIKVEPVEGDFTPEEFEFINQEREFEFNGSYQNQRLQQYSEPPIDEYSPLVGLSSLTNVDLADKVVICTSGMVPFDMVVNTKIPFHHICSGRVLRGHGKYWAIGYLDEAYYDNLSDIESHISLNGIYNSFNVWVIDYRTSKQVKYGGQFGSHTRNDLQFAFTHHEGVPKFLNLEFPHYITPADSYITGSKYRVEKITLDHTAGNYNLSALLSQKTHTIPLTFEDKSANQFGATLSFAFFMNQSLNACPFIKTWKISYEGKEIEQVNNYAFLEPGILNFNLILEWDVEYVTFKDRESVKIVPQKGLERVVYLTNDL